MNDINQMLADCIDASIEWPKNAGKRFSRKELEFIDVIAEIVQDGYTLNKRQIEKLKGIWNKVNG